jgi:hypothetical protein
MLRPPGRRILPRLLPPERQHVDQAVKVSELLGAAPVGVPRAVHLLAVAQEHVDREPASGGAPMSAPTDCAPSNTSPCGCPHAPGRRAPRRSDPASR